MKNKLLLLGVLLSYFCLCSNAEVVVTGPDSCPGGGRISCTGLICAVGKNVISCIDAQGNRSMSFCLTDAN